MDCTQQLKPDGQNSNFLSNWRVNLINTVQDTFNFLLPQLTSGTGVFQVANVTSPSVTDMGASCQVVSNSI